MDATKETPTDTAPSASPDGRPLAIETFGLTRRFGDLTALDHLDLHIPHGEIFGLLGPNGAGKSTTIKMLATLLAPTSGTARIAGFDILQSPAEVRRRIGYVPQLVSADGGLTAYENLDFSGRLYGIHGAERKRRIAEALQFVDSDRVREQVGQDLLRRHDPQAGDRAGHAAPPRRPDPR